MRVPFHDAVKLWTSFIKFRAPTETIWRRRNPAAAGIPFDTSVSDLGLEHGDRLLQACYGSSDANDLGDGLVSSEDIERMLEFHLDRLQRK
jgi:anaphase-promoting complex subunit 5